MHVFICLLQRFTPSVSPRKITRNGPLRTNLVLLRVEGELLSNTRCWCPLSVNQACTPQSRTLKTYTSAAQLTLDFCREKDEFFISEILQLKINKTIPLRLAPPSRLDHPLLPGEGLTSAAAEGALQTPAGCGRWPRGAARGPRGTAAARRKCGSRELGPGGRQPPAPPHGAQRAARSGAPFVRPLAPPGGGRGTERPRGGGHFRGQARRQGAPTPPAGSRARRREPRARRPRGGTKPAGER